MSDFVHHGGCACGAVRFQLPGRRLNIGNCHCRQCQRSVGAPFVTWASVRAARLAVTGEVWWWRSSERAERGFCPTCGASLFFRPLRGDFVDVTVVSFDEPAALAPTFAIWTSARQPWTPMDPALPAHAEDGPDLVAR